jgi:7-keto-8-aminopelargonate synthetase-like enzyme
LTDEIDTLQNDLFERMFYFIQTAAKYNLPIVNNDLTPIFYLALGKTEICFKLAKFLQDEGFFCMTTFFPAVPQKNAGLRLTVNNHNTLEDINGILERVAYALPKALEEEGMSMDEIHETFNMTAPNKEVIPQIPLRKIA